MSAKAKTKKLPAGFNDVAEDSDKLGMETKCKGVADFLYNCSTPMTLAIQGDWGTGKSTCMKLISKRLREKNPDLCLIEFNTWQFSLINDGSTLIENLLNVMCSEFEQLAEDKGKAADTENAEEDFSEKRSGLLSKIKVFAKSFGRETAMDNVVARAFLCGRDAFMGKKPEEIPPEQLALIRDILSEKKEDSSAKVIELCQSIRELVTELIGSTGIGDRIFVFIDDLDRLQPKLAVELMECLKNFMDFPGFVFVLAVDRPVVDIGLKAKYGDDFDKAKAGSFFDKIIQVPFTLPVNSYNIESYMKLFLGDDADPETVRRYVGLLTDFDEHNPRSIKRSFNVLQLYEYMMKADSKQDSLEPIRRFRLYSLLLLQLLHEDEYKALTDLIISCGDNTELLRTDLSAAMDEDAPEGGDAPDFELTEMQRVVLGCFLDEDKKLGAAEIKDLISFSVMTNENTAERVTNSAAVNSARALCERLREGPLTLTSGWDALKNESSKEVTSIYAEAHDADGIRRLTLKWSGKSRKLNMSLYPDGMDADTDRSIYFSGLEDHFYDRAANSGWQNDKYAYFYVPADRRITVLSFDRYSPGGPLDTLLKRCGMIEENR